MKRPKTPIQWAVTLGAAAALLVAAFFALPYGITYGDAYVYGPARGLYYRMFRTPPILRASFVEEINPQQAQAQVEKFLSTYRSHNGSYGLRRTVIAGDGTPIDKCLVTENGDLTLVLDFTRNSGSSRDFSIARPGGLDAAPVELGTNASPRSRIYLICYMSGRPIPF